MNRFVDEIKGKLGISQPNRPMLIGVATILVLVAVVCACVLSNTATANNFELKKNESSLASVESEEPRDSETIFVHVSGSVNKPGLYEISKGSRVADVVSAAAGFTDNAAEDSCNLARQVEDGEHIIIASQEETTQAESDSSHGSVSSNNSARLNINTANEDQLQQLPGIGASTAKKIISDRTANGPFKSVDDLLRVSGIGEKKLASLVDLICV